MNEYSQTELIDLNTNSVSHNSLDEKLEGASTDHGSADQELTENRPTLNLADADLLEKIKAIPDKMAFKIGEVADMAGVKQYVLRFWETEFENLRPKKSRHNQRMYTKKDVETVLLIQKLLHVDRFSIEGARAALKKQKQEVKIKANIQKSFRKVNVMAERVKKLRNDILNLKSIF